MDFMTIAFFFVLCMVGSTIQTVCGFGFGVLVMMVFPYLFHSTLSAVVIASFLGMSSSLISASRYRRYINWRKLVLPLAGYFIVSTISVRLSITMNEAIIRRLLGAVMLLMSVYFLCFSGKIKIRLNPVKSLLMGGLSGFMSALFSMSGPPMSVYSLSASESKEEYLSLMQSLTVLSTLYINLVRAANGMFGRHEITFCALGLAAVYLGTLAGKRIFVRLDGDALRRAIYILMAFSGVIMLLKR